MRVIRLFVLFLACVFLVGVGSVLLVNAANLDFVSRDLLDSNDTFFINAFSIGWDKYVYAQQIAGVGNSTVYIFDTSLSTFNLVGSFLGPQDIEGGSIFEDKLFVVGAVGSKVFNIYDLSDPLNPILLSSTPTSGWGEGLAVDETGTIVYFSDYNNNKLYSYNVTNASNPVLITSVDTEDGPCSVRYDGDGYVTVMNQLGRTLQKFNVTNGVPILSASADIGGEAYNHIIHNDIAYIIGDENYVNRNLYIYNLTGNNVSLISNLSDVNGNVNGHSLIHYNGYLYSTGSLYALSILDVKNVSNPIVVTNTDLEATSGNTNLALVELGNVAVAYEFGLYLYNITYLEDLIAPTVYLFPVSNSTSTSREFIYNVSDDSNISSCSLYSEGVFKWTNQTAVNKSINNSINWASIPVGSRAIYISCEDVRGNIGNSLNVTFTVSAEATTAVESSSSGGASSSLPYTISQYLLEQGFNRNAGRNYVWKFNYSNEWHTISFNNFSSSFLTLTVASVPQTFNVKLNEGVLIDIEKDGIYDLNMTYNKYYTTLVNVGLKNVNVSYGVSVGANQTSVMKDDSGVVPELPAGKNDYRWVGIVVLVIVVLIVGYLIFKRQGKRARKR